MIDEIRLIVARPDIVLTCSPTVAIVIQMDNMRLTGITRLSITSDVGETTVSASVSALLKLIGDGLQDTTPVFSLLAKTRVTLV